MDGERIEVIVVDDHLAMRRGVELLPRSEGLRVAGVASRVDEARRCSSGAVTTSP